MNRPVRLLTFTALTGLYTLQPAAAAPQIPSIPIQDGYYDYVTYDQTLSRLFIGRGDGVTVISLHGNTVGFWPLAGRYFHLALPLPGGRVLVTNGDAGRVLLVNATNGQVLDAADVGGHPDSAAYDAKTGTVTVFNAATQKAAFLLLNPLRKVSELDIGDAAEFAAADGNGRIFVNLRNRNAVAVISAAQRRVLARWPLPKCDQPSGLAFEASRNVLVAACDNSRASVLDAGSGRSVASIDTCAGADAVIADPDHHRFFIPCGEAAVVDVIGWNADGLSALTQIIPTSANARTGAYVPASDTLYLPSVQTGTDTIPQFGGTTPKPLAGTARLLVIHPWESVSAPRRN